MSNNSVHHERNEGKAFWVLLHIVFFHVILELVLIIMSILMIARVYKIFVVKKIDIIIQVGILVTAIFAICGGLIVVACLKCQPRVVYMIVCF